MVGDGKRKPTLIAEAIEDFARSVSPSSPVVFALIEKRSGLLTVAEIVNEGDTEVAKRVTQVIPIPATNQLLMPILMSIPLQLLAYHIAVLLGADVDQPRNLAKSVTVE